MSGIGVAIVLIVSGFALIKKPSYKWSFHGTDDSELIDGVLRFAEQHRDGRYLVEVPDFSFVAAALDGRSLNSYLGAQGNEAASVVFREASPNAIFFNPLANAFSAYSDNFGISSVLADDLDFIEQPLANHLERARFVGIKYLVIVSPEIKIRLAKEPQVKVAYDSRSGWTVFELQGEPMPRVRALRFTPALVVSAFSLKQRRRNEYSFVRFAEEQFADGWFDVLLARSTETRIDKIRELNQFGAVILDSYEYDNESEAFERLRDFARDRLLILLSSSSPLFRRIKAAIVEFPHAKIIERTPQEKGEWLEANAPGFRYGSSPIRTEWKEIRRALDANKIAVNTTLIGGNINQTNIAIRPATPLTESVPVLIDTTYHPKWRRGDEESVFAVTPFFMLSFIREPTQIAYTRRRVDWMGLSGSAATLFFLCAYIGWGYRKRLM